MDGDEYKVSSTTLQEVRATAWLIEDSEQFFESNSNWNDLQLSEKFHLYFGQFGRPPPLYFNISGMGDYGDISINFDGFCSLTTYDDNTWAGSCFVDNRQPEKQFSPFTFKEKITDNQVGVFNDLHDPSRGLDCKSACTFDPGFGADSSCKLLVLGVKVG